LVVIDHYRDLTAEALLHRIERDEIILERWIAKPELDRAEAAGKEFLRLVRQLFRRHQPEAAGIIGGNPLGRAAEERRKRATGRDRQGVPGRHVEPRHGHTDNALDADEGEALGQPAPKVDGRKALAFDRARHFLEDFRDRRNRGRKITPEIGASGDALLGFEINEQQRDLGDDAAAGAERICRRHLDGDRMNRMKCQ